MSEIIKNDCQGEYVNELEIAMAAGYEHGQADAHEQIASLQSQLKEAREIIKPFASFTGKDNYGEDQIDIIGERGSCGNYCVPDSHGFEIIWADENDGQTVHFTAGQFRRARAFLSKTEGKDG